jgi:hypothetical protein
LIGDGVDWVPGDVNFTKFIQDTCDSSVSGLPLSCLDDVNDLVGPVDGKVIRHNGAEWTNEPLGYEDLAGAPEGTVMKGIGGGVHFSSLNDQTQVLNPTVLGTLNFTDGEAYRVTTTLDDLNGVVVIPYIGGVPGEYAFEAFYYHAGSPNVVVSIYDYTTARMNSGSAVGTPIGSFTTQAAPGYAITTFEVNATASPAVWIPQTTTNDVFVKAIL